MDGELHAERNLRMFVDALPVSTTHDLIASTRRLLERLMLVACENRLGMLEPTPTSALMEIARTLPVEMAPRVKAALGQACFRATRQGGRYTNVRATKIRYSTEIMLPGVSDAVRRDTLGHEVAHVVAALALGETGHGHAWKILMIRMGLSAKHCATADTMRELGAARAAAGLPAERPRKRRASAPVRAFLTCACTSRITGKRSIYTVRAARAASLLSTQAQCARCRTVFRSITPEEA